MRFAIVVAARLVATAVAVGVNGHTSDVLHVSPDGRGDFCLAQVPCSLTTARDRARRQDGDVVVELGGGPYRLTTPFTLGPNDIGCTPYSGVSVGWGWGWASGCDLQAKQGLSQPCAHGSTYAGGNHVVGDHVHSVMGELNDGGPIYPLGGQASRSEFTGNVLGECVNGCNAIYHDEGSSLWHTHDNVVKSIGGSLWLNLWTPTVHDDRIVDDYTDTGNYDNNGTNITFQPSTVVPDGNWPPAAQAVIAAAGTGTPKPALVDDDDLRVAYHGSWSFQGGRSYGDLDSGVHHSQQNGASATITFQGTGISLAVSKLDGTYFLVDGFQLTG